MIAAIVIGCYVVGVVVTARWYCATDDAGDHGESRFNGTLLGLIWPIALPIAAVVVLLTLPTLGVKTRRDRQMERDKADARIAELEHEAGITS